MDKHNISTHNKYNSISITISVDDAPPRRRRPRRPPRTARRRSTPGVVGCCTRWLGICFGVGWLVGWFSWSRRREGLRGGCVGVCCQLPFPEKTTAAAAHGLGGLRGRLRVSDGLPTPRNRLTLTCCVRSRRRSYSWRTRSSSPSPSSKSMYAFHSV